MTGELVERHGGARRAGECGVRPRPEHLSEATVQALGKLTEALEVVEQARGLLYGFHRLCGTADLTLQRAVELLDRAGHGALAADVAETLVGRDLFDGQWSFEIVEKYDRGYWSVFRDVERHARETLRAPAPHLFEAGMKDREQRRGDRTEGD